MAQDARCGACHIAIPSPDLARGGAIFAAGEWFCRACCIDGSLSGASLSNPALVSQPGELGPATSGEEVAELKRKQQVLVKEVKRLRLVLEEAEEKQAATQQAVTGASQATDEAAQEMRVAIDQAAQTEQELRSQLQAATEKLSSMDAEAGASENAQVTSLQEELTSARAELSTAQDQLKSASENAGKARDGERALRGELDAALKRLALLEQAGGEAEEVELETVEPSWENHEPVKEPVKTPSTPADGGDGGGDGPDSPGPAGDAAGGPSIGASISAAMEFFKAHPVPAIVDGLLVMLMASVSFGVLWGPMTLGYYGMFKAHLDGEEVKVGGSFSGFSMVVPTLILTLLVMVLQLLGLMLCILPVVLVPPLYFLAIVRIQRGEESAIEALKIAWDDCKPNLMIHVLAFLAFYGVYLLGYLACGLGMLVTLPVAMAASLHYAESVLDEAAA